MEVFCIANLINCMLEADGEFVIMDFHFVVDDGGCVLRWINVA